MIIKLPGLVDCHVHLRVPGGEHKEDFITGSKAALAGGITTLLAMPNTHPPVTRPDQLQKVQAEAKEKAFCTIFFFAGASPENFAQLPELSNQAVALKIYLNETFGPLRVGDRRDLERCLSGWGTQKPVAVHAEGRKVDRIIELCQATGTRIHVCHVSRRIDVEKISKAKAQGLPITCEVTPHHLFLNNEDAKRLGPFAYMKPTLGDQKDQDALWDHLHSTIDCVASDHAPHTIEEKENKTNCPPGVPGLETELPLMLTAVHEGRLSLERLIALMATNPARIYGLPAPNDTWIEVDVDQPLIVSNRQLQTKCGWSPFNGRKVFGKVQKAVIDGYTVYANDRFYKKEN